MLVGELMKNQKKKFSLRDYDELVINEIIATKNKSIIKLK